MGVLGDELSGDPLSRGYAGMTDAEAAADMQIAYRSRDRSSMSGDEIFAATDSGEWGALTDAQRSQWLAFCGRDSIDPFGSANVAFVQDIFGTGPTLTALQANRVESITRAAELGLTVNEGAVNAARNP